MEFHTNHVNKEYNTFKQNTMDKLLREREGFTKDLYELKTESIIIRPIHDRYNLEIQYAVFIDFINSPRDVINCIGLGIPHTRETPEDEWLETSSLTEIKNPIIRIIMYIQEDCIHFIESYTMKLEGVSHKKLSNKLALIQATSRVVLKMYNFFKSYSGLIIDLILLIDRDLFTSYYYKFRSYPYMLHSLYRRWVTFTDDTTETVGQLHINLSPVMNIPFDEIQNLRELPQTPRPPLMRSRSDVRIPILKTTDCHDKTKPSRWGVIKSSITPKSTDRSNDTTLSSGSRNNNTSLPATPKSAKYIDTNMAGSSTSAMNGSTSSLNSSSRRNNRDTPSPVKRKSSQRMSPRNLFSSIFKR